MKEYIFTGTCTFSILAESEEEAWEKFNDSRLDDVDFDYPEIKEIKPLSD